jgi:hypothetical protein
MTIDKDAQNKDAQNENIQHNNRLPDYRISFVSDMLFNSRRPYESFDMFIDERVRINDEKESVKGIIANGLKVGEFNGELSDKVFDCTIKYYDAAIFFGIKKLVIQCNGSKNKSAYIGKVKNAKENPMFIQFTEYDRFGIKKYITKPSKDVNKNYLE